jgi:hypothetical protein
MDTKVYFIDRKLDVFCAKIFYNLDQQYNETLFDGELVRGRDNHLYFVVFDTLVVSGHSVMRNKNLFSRLDSIREILHHLNTSQQHKVLFFNDSFVYVYVVLMSLIDINVCVFSFVNRRVVSLKGHKMK